MEQVACTGKQEMRSKLWFGKLTGGGHVTDLAADRRTK